MTPQLTPIVEANIGVLQEGARSLIGRRLLRVLYLPLRDAARSTQRWRDDVHEVELGVRLVTETSTITFSWEQDDRVEGLGLTTTVLPAPPGTSWVEVSDLHQWRDLVGTVIDDVGAGWHTSDEGCPRSVWSVRLGSRGGRAVTLALGELEGEGQVSYSADSLLVIFDERVARSYDTLASFGSAWGQGLEP